jgi:acetyl esterase/lipase
MRWVFLNLAGGLLAVSLLTIGRAWNAVVWKVAIVAGEFGHFLGILALVLVCLIVAHGFVMEGGRPQTVLSLVAALMALGAVGLFFSPTYFATRIGQALPAKFETAFGQKPSTRTVFNLQRMFSPWSAVDQTSVSTHVFAHQNTPNALKLDLYAAKRASVADLGPDSGLPCVVMIHGGGWDSGHRAQLTDFNHWLAAEGYVVAAISYRLAPQFPWPAQREDTLAALQWLKTHAREFGIDPTRLVLMGRSAGAQIASAVGYGENDPAIRGVIGLYGVYDMEFVWSISRTDDVLNSVNLMNQYLGGAPTALNQVAYDSASAQGMVRGPDSTPPTLLMHGTIDTLCWVKHSQRLAARLSEAEVPHVMVELPWAVHAFDYTLNGPSGQLTTYAVKAFLGAVCEPNTLKIENP